MIGNILKITVYKTIVINSIYVGFGDFAVTI